MNIPIVQGVLRIGEGKVNLADGKVATESDVSLQKIKLPEAQEGKTLSDNSAASKEQCDPLEIVYPPFFPLGNTQGIYSVLNQTKKDNASVASMEKQDADNSINTEYVSAQRKDQLALDGDKMLKNDQPKSNEVIGLGSVLDLKV